MTACVPLTEERKALIRQRLDEGWSWSQIQKTEGVRWKTMKKYFNGTQWTLKQGAELGAAVRHAQQKGVYL